MLACLQVSAQGGRIFVGIDSKFASCWFCLFGWLAHQVASEIR